MSRFQISPPFVVTEAQVAQTAEVLAESLDAAGTTVRSAPREDAAGRAVVTHPDQREGGGRAGPPR
jgi:hypothetical protein